MATPTLELAEQAVHEAEEHFVESFFLVGEALIPIRNHELWRQAGFKSWGAYCGSDHLDYSKRHADRLIQAASIRPLLEVGPIGPNQWNESQIRELIRLPWHRDIKRAVKKIATRVDKGEKLTARLVKDVVDKDMGEGKYKPPPPPPRVDSNGDELLDEFGRKRPSDELMLYIAHSARDLGIVADTLDEVPQDAWEIYLENSYRRELMDKLSAVASRIVQILEATDYRPSPKNANPKPIAIECAQKNAPPRGKSDGASCESLAAQPGIRA